MCMRSDEAYPLSLLHIEETVVERGVDVGHVRAHRWAVKVQLVLARLMRQRKHPVGLRWQVDETCVKLCASTKEARTQRHSKCPDKLSEQDHQAVKRGVRPLLKSKNSRCARAVIAGLESCT